jgi:hypothetical protein
MRAETRRDDEANLNVFMRQILLFLIKEVRGQETETERERERESERDRERGQNGTMLVL